MTELKSTIGDEYSNAGIENLKILLITSREGWICRPRLIWRHLEFSVYYC